MNWRIKYAIIGYSAVVLVVVGEALVHRAGWPWYAEATIGGAFGTVIGWCAGRLMWRIR